MLDKTNGERKILVILGDFNINLLDDQSLDVNHFVDCLSSNSVLPLITLPTRFSNTHNETLIDNIFSGTQDFDIKSGNILAGISDHLPQFAIFNKIKFHSKTKDTFYKDWKSFSEKDFLDDFQKIDWNKKLCFDEKDAGKSLDIFINTVNELTNKHVPSKRITKKQAKGKPWITNGIKQSIIHR